MEPVNYAKHCSACHPLTFDQRITEPAPHKDPAIIHEYLTRTFTAWIAAHPQELRGGSNTDLRIPGAQDLPRNAPAWIAAGVADAERLLSVKTCKECHDLGFATSENTPQVPKANLTTRWLKRGNFDHPAHQMIVCSSCHQQASTSKLTSDVLLPGIEVCQSCHRSG